MSLQLLLLFTEDPPQLRVSDGRVVVDNTMPPNHVRTKIQQQVAPPNVCSGCFITAVSISMSAMTDCAQRNNQRGLIEPLDAAAMTNHALSVMNRLHLGDVRASGALRRCCTMMVCSAVYVVWCFNMMKSGWWKACHISRLSARRATFYHCFALIAGPIRRAKVYGRKWGNVVRMIWLG